MQNTILNWLPDFGYLEYNQAKVFNVYYTLICGLTFFYERQNLSVQRIYCIAVLAAV